MGQKVNKFFMLANINKIKKKYKIIEVISTVSFLKEPFTSARLVLLYESSFMSLTMFIILNDIIEIEMRIIPINKSKFGRLLFIKKLFNKMVKRVSTM